MAIVGPSGSGKSTLLSVLGLLDTATSGSYKFNGFAVEKLGDKERTRLRRDSIGFVFQAFHLIDHLNARENVEYSLAIAGVSGPEARVITDRALTAVGLSHRVTAFPTTLSGGEQQRVAIARAIAGQPQLLLCDEPTGNLDSESSNKILELLMQSRSPQSSLVLVTHDLEVAARCTRRLHVADGVVTELPQ